MGVPARHPDSVAQERAESTQRELMALVQRILQDKHGFVEFAHEAEEQFLRFGFHEMDEELRGVLMRRRQKHMQTRAADTYTLADGAVLVSPIMDNQINVARAMFSSLKDLGCRVIVSSSGASITAP
jgi:hypothetical protein